MKTLEVFAWGVAVGYLLRAVPGYAGDIVRAKRDARAKVAAARRRADGPQVSA